MRLFFRVLLKNSLTFKSPDNLPQYPIRILLEKPKPKTKQAKESGPMAISARIDQNFQPSVDILGEAYPAVSGEINIL